ncbi:MAG: Diaminopimelate decarboxylase [Tenericutes bacterium ADurb.Bin140]|nr:MAG: Diaminopimelate decarboxylase [Tenericutes bacterium ADurb.Bin140]
MTKSMQIKNNQLYLGKFPLSDLVRKYQTPLMVFDWAHIRERMNEFTEYTKSSLFSTRLVYASKAFLAPYFCVLMKEAGWWIDATSGGDLYIIEQSGFPLSRVVFHGNNKSTEELKVAVTKGVGIIVVDHIEELRKIVQLATQYRSEVNTMLRINPGIEAHTHYYIQTSLLSSKFGLSIEDAQGLEEIMQIYLHNPMVRLLGFHAHIGSQIIDVKPFVACARQMLEFSHHTEKLYHYPLRHLNLGGGFGIRYTDEEIDYGRLLSLLLNEINANLLSLSYQLDALYFEPGRAIVGEAGTTLYTVDYVKSIWGGKKYLFIDGGMTDNIRTALYQAKYRVANVNTSVSEKMIIADVVGKCCESGDIIAQDVEIPFPDQGDVLAVFSTGAYCYPMAMNYNGALRPAVIVVDGDQIEEVCRRETYQDLEKLFTKK